MLDKATEYVLLDAAFLLDEYGLHTGPQFTDPTTGALDVCAAIYLAAEHHLPNEFGTDEDTSIRIIHASARTMAAIRAVSDSLDTEVCHTEIAPDVTVPDYLEHVANWAAPIGDATPHTTSEVIGRLFRTATQDQNVTPLPAPAIAAL